jgi:hypothetical protein
VRLTVEHQTDRDAGHLLGGHHRLQRLVDWCEHRVELARRRGRDGWAERASRGRRGSEGGDEGAAGGGRGLDRHHARCEHDHHSQGCTKKGHTALLEEARD